MGVLGCHLWQVGVSGSISREQLHVLTASERGIGYFDDLNGGIGYFRVP